MRRRVYQLFLTHTDLWKARWLGLEPAFVLDVGIALRWTSPANGTGWSTTGGRSLGQQRNQSKSWAATQKGGKVLNNLVAYGFSYVFCLVVFIGGLSFWETTAGRIHQFATAKPVSNECDDMIQTIGFGGTWLGTTCCFWTPVVEVHNGL